MHRRPNPFLPLVWLAMVVFMIAAPLRAQEIPPDQPLTLAEYREELAAAIATLEATPDEATEETLQQLQDHFATITQVKFPKGDLADVRSLLDDVNAFADVEESLGEEALLSSPKDIALAKLRGAMAQIDASANDNTAARLAILSEILARPEFNAPMSLWDRFWQWFENLISVWLPDPAAEAEGGWLAWLIRLVPWIVTILIVAAVIWLLSYWLQHLLRSFVTDARLVEGAAGDEMPASAAEARQQARAAAESGLYRDAVRRLYLAALLQLAEDDLITYERSLTNREVLVRVPADSPIRPHLEPIVATFDQVWYGVREPDQATFHAYEQEIDQLAAEAGRAASHLARQGGA